MVVALINTIGLIAAMFVCALFVSKITGIELITSILAFAPGGIAEMATTSIVLQADSTLVVAVQVLRILTIWLLLPPLFRMFHQWGERKEYIHTFHNKYVNALGRVRESFKEGNGENI